MAVTAKMVKELREMTGAGMMDCKKALVEADGDLEAAKEVLKEKEKPVSDVKIFAMIKKKYFKGKTSEEAFAVILAGTREHTRVLLPWNEFPAGTRKELIQQEKEEVRELLRTKPFAARTQAYCYLWSRDY